GTWGFEHTKACFRDDIIPFVKNLKDLFTSFDQYLIDKVSEVQKTFKQMEMAVEQNCAAQTKFQSKMESVLKENDCLLKHALGVDIVNIVVNDCMNVNCLTVDACEQCVTTESELQLDFIKKENSEMLLKQYNTLKKHCISLELNNQLNTQCVTTESELKSDFIIKENYEMLLKQYNTLKKHCISLELDNQLNTEIFQRDNVKLKEKIKSLRADEQESKVKDIETQNIELDHRVTKLTAKNNHLKQTYKQLFDSIKSSRVQSKEQCNDLINQVNLKSVEVADLNASLQERVLVNTKFLNTLPTEWSKFVTDVKLVWDLHTTNVDQLHAYLGQHEYHANELNRTPYPHHQLMYQQSQFQPQATSYQTSPYGPTYHNSQFVSSGPSSLTHSISYPGTDTSSLVNHNAYMASSSAPRIAYAQMDQQSPEYSPPEAGLVVSVFHKGDDPIDAINHMMLFLTSVVASRYPATNN
nr:hypothetical protein [Tanacetum cinerariifolium]